MRLRETMPAVSLASGCTPSTPPRGRAAGRVPSSPPPAARRLPRRVDASRLPGSGRARLLLASGRPDPGFIQRQGSVLPAPISFYFVNFFLQDLLVHRYKFSKLFPALPASDLPVRPAIV